MNNVCQGRIIGKSSLTRFISLLLPALMAQGAALAARPLVTDDARLADPKACQLEAWVRRNDASTEMWALPACNPTGAFELALGGALIHENGDTFFGQEVVQAKTLFKPLEPNGWGLGVSVGTTRYLRRESANGWPGDAYINFPLSISFYDDKWVAHVNAGAVRRRDLDRTIVTWGFGHEVQLREDAFLIAEVYANDRGRPFYQAGLRYVLVKDRIQMDATYGNRAVSETGERWISVGIRLLGPPVFP
jgi:hypothetical protein